jgi:nicotinamidase/pyrazinamidase
MPGSVNLSDSDLLLVVDVQNDFCSGGALAVPDGDLVVPVANALARLFPHVVLTQDWHPKGHLSFASSHPGKNPFETVNVSYGGQVLWPDHCVQGTGGADFHPDLRVLNCELVLRKGYNPELDSYSAFYENDHKTATGFAGYLKERGITRLFLVGLATDFCVLYSALDARSAGFEVFVIEDGCRAIDLEGSLDAAWKKMADASVSRIHSIDIPDTAAA